MAADPVRALDVTRECGALDRPRPVVEPFLACRYAGSGMDGVGGGSMLAPIRFSAQAVKTRPGLGGKLGRLIYHAVSYAFTYLVNPTQEIRRTEDGNKQRLTPSQAGA